MDALSGTIPFTQYLLPDGRQVAVSIDRPAEISEMADQIIKSGFRFECEVLTTGDVSLTIHDPDEEEDVAIRVARNGKEVSAAVDEMIRGFHGRMVNQ